MYTGSAASEGLSRGVYNPSLINTLVLDFFLMITPVACKTVNSINSTALGSSLSEQTNIEWKEVAETVTQPFRLVPK